MSEHDARQRPLEYPAKYLQGLKLFNDEEFFACHDALEEVWTETVGEEKQFYQGLIHAAVSLFHFENGNLGGARKMHASSLKYLETYVLHYLGIDVEAFAAQLWFCFKELREATEASANLQLDRSLIPKIPMPNEAQER